MAKLTAEMVIDLRDNTGRATQTVIGNLSRLRRAERDYDLAKMGMRLNREQRAHEDLIRARAMAQAQAEEEALARRRENYQVWAGRAVMGAVAVAGVATAAASAFKNYAEIERTVNRIVINSGKGAETIQPTIGRLQQIAADTHQGFDTVVEGLQTLIASGRELDEALAFLPSVAITAQASGSAMNDIALAADAVASSMGIAAGDMQKAFDIMVAGGKLGKFETRDMAQYLPSLAPAFAALGYKGTEGVMKMVAALQVMRSQTGSSAEAATLMSNVVNKIYTADTAKKFKDMGINLPKALEKATAEGRDILDVFKQLAIQAVNGDLSKLPLLFTDAEMLKGMRALLSTGGMFNELTAALNNVDGTALKDFNQIAADSAAKIQDMSNAWDRFSLNAGARLADYVTPVLDKINRTLEEADAKARAVSGESSKVTTENKEDFIKRWHELNPQPKGIMGGYGRQHLAQRAYDEALIKKGRGEIDSIFAVFDQKKAREAMLDHYINRVESHPGRGPSTITKGRPSMNVRAGQIPVPIPRPKPDGPAMLLHSARDAEVRFPNRGYRDRRAMTEDQVAERIKDAQLSPLAKGLGFGDTKVPGLAAPGYSGPQPVTLTGPVTTQPSGVQKVEVTNMQRPNVTINLTVPVQQVMEDPRGAAQRLGYEVRDAILGSQADTGN